MTFQLIFRQSRCLNQRYESGLLLYETALGEKVVRRRYCDQFTKQFVTFVWLARQRKEVWLLCHQIQTTARKEMDTVQEAKRYIDNAREILREKANKEDGYYQDSKYVKMAGHTAYAGIVVALDGLLGKKGKGRKDVD